MTRLVISVVMLTIVYALALASLDPWDLAIGAMVAIALLLPFRPVTIGRHSAHLQDCQAALWRSCRSPPSFWWTSSLAPGT
jgi:hypothetical protein